MALRIVMRLTGNAAYAAGLVLYALTVAAGYCIILIILPLWFTWQLSWAGWSIARHVVLEDALAVLAAVRHHDYWNRSPKTIAVSEFVDLGREQAAVSQRLCQAEAQHQLLVQVCSEGHGAPAAFVVHAMAASSEWAALHRGRPASRLALSADLAHLCTPSYHTSLSAPTPSRFANTSFHRTAFIRLALSLLPTPLRLLSAQGELSLWTIFHLIPSLYHLLITITRLHALVIFYRLVGGRALSLDNQVPAVNKLARCLELLGRDVETLRSPLSGPAGLSLVKVSAEMELLDEEERRLAARKHEALLLALHRWKEEKGGRRRRR